MSKQQTKARQQATAVKTPATLQSNESFTDQRQSVDIVQNLILASLSCICFTRALFPDKAFEPREYNKSNILSFNQFVDGIDIEDRQKSPRGTNVQILRRSRSSSADRFLDWLDGVYDALKRNVLRCLQLNVFEDEQNPQNVVEAWTFTFAYASKTHNSTGVASMDIKGPNGRKVTYANATWGLEAIVRQIIYYCGTLPRLPETRFISLHIFFTDDCDPHYQPHGFMESSENDAVLKFPKNSNYELCSNKFPRLDSGHHSVTLKVDHLSRTAESFDEGSDFELPTSFIYVVPKIREHDIDTEMVEEYEKSPTPCPESWSGRIAQSKDPRKSKEPSQTSTSVVLVEDSLGADANVEPIDAVPPVAHDDDVVKEDIDLDDSISGALHGPIRQTELLMAPSQTSQLPEDSLGASVSQQQKDRTVRFRLEQMLKPSSHETQSGDTQLRPLNQEDYPQEAIPKRVAPRVELSQWTVQNLPRSNPRARSTTQTDVIKCPCGRYEENSDFMVCCDFCNTWQHVECYGFLDGNDYQEKMVDPFACYQCMLQGKEMPLLRELQHLALLRKGATVLKNHGYTTDHQLAKHLGCDLPIARDVANHFIHYGYLRREDQTGKKPKGGRRKYIVDTGDVLQKLLQEYFDPTAKIRHHLKLDTGTNTPLTKMSPRKDTEFAVPLRPSSNKPRPSKNKSVVARSTGTKEKILSSRSSNQSTKIATPDHGKEPRTPTKQKRSAEHLETYESAGPPSRKKQFRSAITVVPIGMKGLDSPASLK